ncbi:unnamed protein product [Linum tenue]|uniref:Uncharacterized protein n=1 Tax=Linum tenue TaxID=586396 RepID=A0AAV0Q7Q8_9ROSI|nr:unnamed protein product [Linum tenue]
MGKSLQPQNRISPETERPAVPLLGRRPLQQEPAPPSVQPSSQEDPRPHPQREPDFGVPRHHGIHRRDMAAPEPSSPQRSLCQSRSSFLGQVHRRKGN